MYYKQDHQIVSHLCTEVEDGINEETPAFFVALRSLTAYLILTDTASRPQFINMLKRKDVTDLNKDDLYLQLGKKIKSRMIWMHTDKSKNGLSENKFLPCTCPEKFRKYDGVDGESYVR